jgi:hypothetical protein
MALHHDLLDQASHLAMREPRRPRQASLRRAVSSAYYALFHLLADEGARRLAPAQPALLRRQVQRGFAHRDMQDVCRQFATGSAGKGTAPLLQPPLEPELRQVARAFVELQDARHDADYNLSASFDRVDVLQKVRLVREAFGAWRQVRSSPNAAVFLAAMLLQARWR